MKQNFMHFWLSLSLLLIFLGFEYVFQPNLNFLGPYGLYFIELIWVILTAFALRTKPTFIKPKFLSLAGSAFIYGAAGFLISMFLILGGVKIPFSHFDPLDLVILLLIGPFLEELIYRFALWGLFSSMHREVWFSIIATSVLFSFGHIFALTYVSNEYKTFVAIQGLYTLLLGFALAHDLKQHKNFLRSCLFHLSFNWGFYLALSRL